MSEIASKLFGERDAWHQNFDENSGDQRIFCYLFEVNFRAVSQKVDRPLLN